MPPLTSMELFVGMMTGMVGYAAAQIADRMLDKLEDRRTPVMTQAPLSPEQASQERILRTLRGLP